MPMMGGGIQAGASGADALIAVAQAIQDPNFKAKITELQAREQAATDAENSAQTVIDAATAAKAEIASRETAIAAREKSATETDAKQAQAKAYLDGRQADLDARESALGIAQKNLTSAQTNFQSLQDKAEAAATTRIANAQAALDKRAALIQAQADAATKAMNEANALKADYESRIAKLTRFAAGAA